MSYSSTIKLLAVWLAVAFGAAVVLMVVLLVRQPPEPDQFWRTVRRYFLLSALICCSLPAALVAGRTASALYDWASPTILAYWWVPLTGLVVAPLVGAVVLLRRWEHPSAEPTHLDVAPELPSRLEPAPMWELPAHERHGSLPQ